MAGVFVFGTLFFCIFGRGEVQKWAQLQDEELEIECELAVNHKEKEKKRITAGELDTWGKELRKCTDQWTTNDKKKYKRALSTLSVFVR